MSQKRVWSFRNNNWIIQMTWDRERDVEFWCDAEYYFDRKEVDEVFGDGSSETLKQHKLRF